MSDKKMIIRNCPAFARGIFCKGGDIIDDGCADKTLDSNTLISCQDCTDCILKQIIEKCEQYKKDYITTNGVWLLANNIINSLDIQEVE